MPLLTLGGSLISAGGLLQNVASSTPILQDRVIASWHHSLWNNGQTDERTPYWLDRLADADGGKTIASRGQVGQGRNREYDPPIWDDGYTDVTFPGADPLTTWTEVDAMNVDTLVYLTDNFQGPPASGGIQTDPSVAGNMPDTGPTAPYMPHVADVFTTYETRLNALPSRTSGTPLYLLQQNLPEAAIFFSTPGAASAQDFADYIASFAGAWATWYANLESQTKTAVGAGLADKVQLVPLATVFASVVNNTAASSLTASDWFSDSAPHGNAVTYLFYAMVYYSQIFREAAPTPSFAGSSIPADFTTNYTAIAAHIASELGV